MTERKLPPRPENSGQNGATEALHDPDSRLSKRKVQKQARRLATLLEFGDIGEFEREVSGAESQALIVACRQGKVLARGNRPMRHAAADILISAANQCLQETDAGEFARYTALSLDITDAREEVMMQLRQEIDRFPKLSQRQLSKVAMRLFRKSLPGWLALLEQEPNPSLVAENERRVHGIAGYSNDLMFAVARVINESWRGAGPRDLTRPDAISRASGPFREATRLASQLIALEYAFDSASFGHFVVGERDAKKRAYRLEIADIRLTLIRILSIRRRMMGLIAGRRNDRFLREALREAGAGVINNALVRGFTRAGRGPPASEDFELLHKVLDSMLLQIGANDDLVIAAARGDRFVQMLYHMALSQRLHAAATKIVSRQLGPGARRSFDERIRLDDLLEDLAEPEDRETAIEAWALLTIDLPSRSHWELLRSPFVHAEEGFAHSLMFGDADTWTSHIREILLRGGQTGRHYGEIWEKFLAGSFTETGWQAIGRNIKVVADGAPITEIDLLLVRNDLLLVVEIKALAGSGLNPYDHWKNRETIERGCRQARLAANHILENRGFIASIANQRIADAITHVQPLVLTNESMFDGWEYEGVPVAAETLRKAITVGTKVDYFDGYTGAVLRTDWHLRSEELDTPKILSALRNPIELQLAPERGDVVHHQVAVAGLTLLVPDPEAPPTTTFSA